MEDQGGGGSRGVMLCGGSGEPSDFGRVEEGTRVGDGGACESQLVCPVRGEGKLEAREGKAVGRERVQADVQVEAWAKGVDKYGSKYSQTPNTSKKRRRKNIDMP